MNRLFILLLRVVFILIILISFVPFYYSVEMYNARLLVENGITAKAVVIDVGEKYVELPKYSGYVYKPVFEYSNLENNKITFTHNVPANSTSIRHHLGSTIEIIYYPNKAHSERENSFQGLYLLPFTRDFYF